MRGDEYSENRRLVKARASYNIIDPTAKPNATATGTKEHEFSQAGQVINNNYTGENIYTGNNLFGENGFTIIDTEESIIEHDTQIGFISNSVSLTAIDPDDGSRTYPFPFLDTPKLQFDISKDISVLGMTLHFPEDSIPEKIEIKFLRGAGNVDIIYGYPTSSEFEWRNDLAEEWGTELLDFNKIIIKFEMKEPNKHARVLEVDFGVKDWFYDSDIINIDIDNTINPTGQTIEQDQMILEIKDESKRFDLLNPHGINKYIVEGQPIDVHFGAETSPGVFDWIVMGTYYLDNLKVNDTTVTFTTRDILSMLKDKIWEPEIIPDNTMTNFAYSLLNQGGINKFNVDLTAGLDYDFIEPDSEITLLDGLKFIGIATNCIVYQDVFGVVQLERLNDTWLQDFDISAKDMYSFPTPTLNKPVKGVVINTSDTSYTLGTEPRSIDCPIILDDSDSGQSYINVDVIADHQLNILSNRMNINIEWRQNPWIEVGKQIDIDTEFDRARIIVTEQRYNYNGMLSGSTKGIKKP